MLISYLEIVHETPTCPFHQKGHECPPYFVSVDWLECAKLAGLESVAMFVDFSDAFDIVLRQSIIGIHKYSLWQLEKDLSASLWNLDLLEPVISNIILDRRKHGSMMDELGASLAEIKLIALVFADNKSTPVTNIHYSKDDDDDGIGNKVSTSISG